MNTALHKIIAKATAEPDTNLDNLTEEIAQYDTATFVLSCYAIWGLPTPPVYEMRKNGIKVFVNHSRWIRGKGIHKTRDFIKAGLSGKDFEPRGGKTEVTITFPDGKVVKGRSVCVKGDNFCRRDGLYLAVSDALQIK